MTENWELHWKDYYSILQVHPLAEEEVINAAYTKLARKYHPDTSLFRKSDTHMAEINEAYEVLSNPEKRDRYHLAWLEKVKPEINDRKKSSKQQRKLLFVFPKWWILLTISCIAIGAVIFILNLNFEPISPLIDNSGTIPSSNSTYNLQIKSITLPVDAKTSSGDLFYDHTLKIYNYESTDVRIFWEAHSSLTGVFDSGYISVRKNSYREFTRSYSYPVPGIEEVTYTLYYGKNIIDTLSQTHEITE